MAVKAQGSMSAPTLILPYSGPWGTGGAFGDCVLSTEGEILAFTRDVRLGTLKMRQQAVRFMAAGSSAPQALLDLAYAARRLRKAALHDGDVAAAALELDPALAAAHAALQVLRDPRLRVDVEPNASLEQALAVFGIRARAQGAGEAA